MAIKSASSTSESVLMAGEITLLRQAEAKRTRLKIIHDGWDGARALQCTVHVRNIFPSYEFYICTVLSFHEGKLQLQVGVQLVLKSV